MSQSNNKQSSSGFFRGLVVGAVIAVTIMMVFNQINNSFNMRPLAADSIVSIKDQIQAAWFASNLSLSLDTSDAIKPNLPPVLVRKPMNEETTVIHPKTETLTKVVEALPKVVSVIPKPEKPVWTPPAVGVKSPAPVDTAVVEKQPSTWNTIVAAVTANSPTGGFNPLSRSQCQSKYGTRRYYKDEEKRLPPMLYTFPGSGNTWCRLLVEYSSGILSGAVYNDASLLEPLPGEFMCNHAVSVVKVHPHTHDFESLRTGTFHSDNDKCKKGHVKAFKRAILLIRNPFDSIWSEFQRRVSKSHVSGINRVGFDWHRWQANACSLSHMYHQMWSQHHAGIERHFGKDNYLYIKYEDLKNKNGANVATMKRVTDFLGVPATEEKLSCAFVLAENPDAHRTIDKNTMMTKEDAYTRELTCRMWSLFGEYAAKHGYKPYNGYDCRNDTNGAPYPKIRNVNVGAQGEYDRKWVQPGQALIDFGGYNKTAYLPAEGTRSAVGGGAAGIGGRLKRKPKAKANRDGLTATGAAAGGGAGGGGGRAGGGGKRNRVGLQGGNGAVKGAPAAAANGAAASGAAAGGGSEGGMGQVGLTQPAWK